MKTNWPQPYYSDNKVIDPGPGYRILGKGESLKDAEICSSYDKKWYKTCYEESTVACDKPTDCSYRKPIYLDDPYAPPPEQFNQEGWEIVKDFINKDDIYQYWCPTTKKWIGTYTNKNDKFNVSSNDYLFYYRKKTNLNNQSNQNMATVNTESVKTDHSKWVIKIENEKQFNALKIIAAEYKITWCPLPYNEVKSIYRGKEIGIYCPTSKIDSLIVGSISDLNYNGYTTCGFGEGLYYLLKNISIIIPPKINNYDATYKKGDHSVQFGCASISKSLFDLSFPYQYGNRQIKSLTLDSGVTLTIEQIKEVKKYMEEIDKLG